ncbi:MAG: NADH dehydrogenase [ubiquinone] 1 alpha subcomplex assembly factor 1 [Marivirga sp.]|jgi:NADH dehydrogenase [ubiquinone] 1 alpha subcomplex assembly factor 1
MQLHAFFITVLLFMSSYKIDFTTAELADWYIVNDGVMGGLSSGKAQITDEGFLFFGTVSLRNNGGFTSLRSVYREYDLQEFTEVEVRYKSTGLQQALQFSVNERFYVPNYKVHLPNSEQWVIKRFKLSEVQQYRLGDATGAYLTKGVLDDIIRISFITDEKKGGEFSLEVDYISFQ